MLAENGCVKLGIFNMGMAEVGVFRLDYGCFSRVLPEYRQWFVKISHMQFGLKQEWSHYSKSQC